MAHDHRPQNFGYNNQREYIVQDSEVAIRIENNAAGNPVYIGRAKVGTTETEPKWQISLQEYDASDNFISRTWPENDAGVPSSDYTFLWTQRAIYTYN